MNGEWSRWEGRGDPRLGHWKAFWRAAGAGAEMCSIQHTNTHSTHIHTHRLGSVGTFWSSYSVVLFFYGLLPAAGHDCSRTRCLRCSLLMYTTRFTGLVHRRYNIIIYTYIYHICICFVQCTGTGVDGQSRLLSYTTVRVSN